ncbi:hypothetical protein GCM10010341_15880 [Streptomyces noursei]|nr:hypothetical protein GCM10010341_15880 [Streptomyces noursei]
MMRHRDRSNQTPPDSGRLVSARPQRRLSPVSSQMATLMATYVAAQSGLKGFGTGANAAP